jgi:hypothetical protein
MRDWDIMDKLRLIVSKRDVREALALVRLKEAKAVEQRQQRPDAEPQRKAKPAAEDREQPKQARCE